MGTWGAGNFDNDDALDYVSDMVSGLVREIDDCFADEAENDLYKNGEAIVLPAVHILSVLTEHCSATPPKPGIVAGWRNTYLARFDELIWEGESEDFARERRAVIAATFDKLELQSRECWPDK